MTSRVPTRTDTDDRYFGDSFQKMPLHGYTRMFENMLDHPNIKVMLNVDFREIEHEVRYDRLIYTGPIDEFFDYRFGELPYRSLRFRHETLDQEYLQPVAVVNYPAEEVAHTRITEYKHLTGQTHPKTSITYEYPAAEGDPYYPVPRPENAALFRRYQTLADAMPDVTFVGRLATYRYYNMDQVVAQALSVYARMVKAGSPRCGSVPGRADRRGGSGRSLSGPAASVEHVVDTGAGRRVGRPVRQLLSRWLRVLHPPAARRAAARPDRGDRARPRRGPGLPIAWSTTASAPSGTASAGI